MLHGQGPHALADHFRLCSAIAALALAACAAASSAQDGAASHYAQRNTLGIFGAYSWDSSRILLGDAEQRMLLNIGVSYSRRLTINRVVNWQYDGELMPVALESDPLTFVVENQTSPTVDTFSSSEGPAVSCSPQTISYSFPGENGVTYSGTATFLCRGRRWTMGEAMSPLGMRWNFLPRRRLQPLLGGHAGYMYSTQPIPTVYAGSFNFTFDIGAGVEYFQTQARSIRVEYRYHHISNKDSAPANPGIDNGLVQVTYAFRLGRH